MDKLKSKEMFLLHNVPPPYYVVRHDADMADVESRHGHFGFGRGLTAGRGKQPGRDEGC